MDLQVFHAGSAAWLQGSSVSHSNPNGHEEGPVTSPALPPDTTLTLSMPVNLPRNIARVTVVCYGASHAGHHTILLLEVGKLRHEEVRQ